jgi:hypothetical protein
MTLPEWQNIAQTANKGKAILPCPLWPVFWSMMKCLVMAHSNHARRGAVSRPCRSRRSRTPRRPPTQKTHQKIACWRFGAANKIETDRTCLSYVTQGAVRPCGRKSHTRTTLNTQTQKTHKKNCVLLRFGAADRSATHQTCRNHVRRGAVTRPCRSRRSRRPPTQKTQKTPPKKLCFVALEQPTEVQRTKHVIAMSGEVL